MNSWLKKALTFGLTIFIGFLVIIPGEVAGKEKVLVLGD